MKWKSMVAGTALVVFSFYGNGFALPMSSSDLWDISQGSTVTSDSGVATYGTYYWRVPT